MNHTEAMQTSATERYLLGEMSEIEREAFESHFFDCEECAEDVRLGALLSDGAKAGLIGQSNVRSMTARTSPRSTTRRWQKSPIIPWAVAAAFGMMAVYQSLAPSTGDVRLSTQAIRPVTIHRDSRGAEPVVAVDANQTIVSLALDLDVSAETRLTYELRTSGGKPVSSGSADAPIGGAPLLLLIPVWTLSPGEHYILSVRRQSDGQLIDDYRFAIARQ